MRTLAWHDATRVRQPARVIAVDDIRFFGKQRKILDERGRRLFAANEAMAHGYGGVMATSGATGWRALNQPLRDR